LMKKCKRNLERFKEPLKVKLVKILIKGTSDKSLLKAEEILKKAKSVKDLEKFTKEKPKWFDEFSLPPEIAKLIKMAREGQILGPIRLKNSYLILGIEKIKPEKYLPLSKVRKEVEKELKYEKLKALAQKKGEKLYIEAVKEGDLKKAAKKLELKVKTTDYLTKTALVDMIDSFENADKIFSASPGEIFAPMDSAHGIYVFELLEKKPPRSLKFEEAFKKVKEDYLRDQTREICQKKALELISLWKKGFSENKAVNLGFRVKTLQVNRLQSKNFFEVSKPGVIEEPFFEKNMVKVVFVEKIKSSKEKFSTEEIKKAKALLTFNKRENFWQKWFREALEEAKVEVKK